MTTRRSTINEDTHFWTLKLLQERPGITQRALAKEVGMSLSGINYCIGALAEKGWRSPVVLSVTSAPRRENSVISSSDG